MRSLDARVARLEGAGRAPVCDLTAAQRADLAGELRALLAAMPHEDDRAALLRRLDDGSASAADRARLAGCSVDMLRLVTWLDDKT
ncbi:MAG: hypothetical protein IPG77_19700 [Betaproteobacteria bacterium]|jgi:hypothetical protein|nr:hypothetical protein [Betaproteobacteria bacterium]